MKSSIKDSAYEISLSVMSHNHFILGNFSFRQMQNARNSQICEVAYDVLKTATKTYLLTARNQIFAILV